MNPQMPLADVRRAVAGEIYGKRLPSVAAPLSEIAAVHAFLRSRGLGWTPIGTSGLADDPGQHFNEEVREYLADARSNFADCPRMAEALDAYEREVRKLLDLVD